VLNDEGLFIEPQHKGDLQVTANGAAIPLLFASGSQVGFQCPLLSPGTLLDVTLEGPNGLSKSADPSVMRDATPELFTVDGTNQGVILLGATNEIAMPTNQAVASRPAQRGEYVTVYANGLGQFVDSTGAGSDSPVPLKNRIRVVVGGIEIDSAFAGHAPGTPGFSQVHVLLPQSVPDGPAVPLYLQVILPDGTVIDSNEVAVAIQ
jgi:uncharacterized protein (TIGR03437 family)